MAPLHSPSVNPHDVPRSGRGLESIRARLAHEAQASRSAHARSLHREALQPLPRAMLVLRGAACQPAALKTAERAYAAAFAAAPALGRTIRVGVCNSSGSVAAVGELIGYEQVWHFVESMEALGYRSMLRGMPVAKDICDMVFVPAESQPASSIPSTEDHSLRV